MKKNAIKAGIIDGNTKSEETAINRPQVDEYADLVKKGSTAPKSGEKALIISRLDEPKTITYDGSLLRISPRAIVEINNVSLLQDNLPNGLILKK